MDDQPHPSPKFMHSPTCDPEIPSHASGMFSHSQQFTVTGGTFTNITKNYAAARDLPLDFRMIPMGDIDLRDQIRVDDHRAVAIDGQKSRVTVAIYQGNDAEEEWRNDLAKYTSMRHPNIMQICGAASSNGIRATLFNDNLIPLQEVLDRHRDSHFSTVYIYACCNKDFLEVHNYIASEFHRGLSSAE
ncbi:hypothetical protein MSAN_02137300 [Mycena sanguinolenta]|uniref:Uncharacterized protein n=1 Tax=Mycena sanguinolenta TaxID=230812 RepID=A0A8H6XFT0_9AGAR|nr:hypothetical protein MSAN_02137300 [Mycena sanguinolenta]